MSPTTTLEERVARLEHEVDEMKRHSNGAVETPWWKKTVGTMRDFPEWAEAVRLGRQVCDEESSSDAGEGKP
jgi:uncharacterized cupin superfamily protein